jgi:hypothetical protein
MNPWVRLKGGQFFDYLCGLFSHEELRSTMLFDYFFLIWFWHALSFLAFLVVRVIIALLGFFRFFEADARKKRAIYLAATAFLFISTFTSYDSLRLQLKYRLPALQFW